MSETTPDATPRQDDTTNDTRAMTPEDAAAHYGVSLRTIQRRMSKGTLQEIERDGKRLVIVTGATNDTTIVMTKSVTDATDDNVSRHPDAALLEHLQAENEYLKGQINAWRLQAEAANRTASETAAALRKALEALPKELPPATATDQHPQNDAATSITTDTDPATNKVEMQLQEDVANVEKAGAEIEEIPAKLEQPGTEIPPAKSTFFSRLFRRG